MDDRAEFLVEKRAPVPGMLPGLAADSGVFKSARRRVSRPTVQAPSAQPPADHDSLTGLPVLAQVTGVIGGLIAEVRRRHRTLALVAFDLDGFRLLRESHGPAHADDTIKRAAAILQSVACPKSVIARHGTDGFIVALSGLGGTADTAACVQQILDLIAVPQDLQGENLQVTASAGIAMFPKDGDDLDTLSHSAHAALRESKLKSAGGLRFHTGNVAVMAKRRIRLEMDLRRAIESDELTLYYQPQFEVSSGRASGVEVLARWFRSDGRAIQPSVFIPLAEQTQLIGALDSWVLHWACTQVGTWRTPGPEPVTLCVNVSPQQIDEAFAASIQRTLQCTGFPARQLELEITESALMSNVDHLIECFGQLKAIGVRIAIDDFGTGYSSLSYLSKLPVDRLKLDKSLVHNLTTRWKDVAILRSIIELGNDLGLAVIAEGVETEQQFQVLMQLGCPQVQGYLLARPAPQNEAKAVLERRWGARYARKRHLNRTAPERLNAS
jgi:diguanylate cyclase (GGDEF)-like protein